MSKGQSNKRRQELVERCDMSSSSQVKMFGRFLLEKEGIDLSKVNISVEGVQIKSFSTLVMGIYELGYQDGLVKFGHAKLENARIESEARHLKEHGRKAKFAFEKSEINNIPK